MQTHNNLIFENKFSSVDMTSTFSSAQISILGWTNFSLMLKWTGTPTGTFKLQASNDFQTVVDWEDITGSSFAVSGAAGQLVYNYDTAPFRWIRVVYTATSGSGTLTKAMLNQKGPV